MQVRCAAAPCSRGRSPPLALDRMRGRWWTSGRGALRLRSPGGRVAGSMITPPHARRRGAARPHLRSRRAADMGGPGCARTLASPRWCPSRPPR
eukprot:15481125-Alexandrium_andersonii.AAC.1